MADILSSPIEYLKGVGPQRADLLKKELGIFTFKDLLEHFPYRHIDKTKINLISEIAPQTEFIQVVGKVMSIEIIGEKRSKRLVVEIKDSSGVLELVWFQGIAWVEKMLEIGKQYFVYGRISFFQGNAQITHPEIELFADENASAKNFLEPVYSSTEKLKARGLGGRQIAKLTVALLGMLSERDIPEILPDEINKLLNFSGRFKAFQSIHFPANADVYTKSVERLKFEELFVAQLRIGLIKSQRHRFSKGLVFSHVGDMFNEFYSKYLPFELTGAQKRVLKELRKDMGSGKQMNRLLQGDVGSGKTIVALLSMLLAIDNSYQACMMAPTEILAKQHFDSLNALLKDMPLSIGILTGSTKPKRKKEILDSALDGSLNILIGTHAIIEDVVQFKNLGFAVI